MDRIEKIVSNLVFFMLCLLTMLLAFESYVQVPYWLQPVGRMHPLVLHFPIGFVVLLVLVNLFKSQLEEQSYQKVNKFLLLLTAFTTTLAAVMGFFLSREEGYSSSLMSVHKWIGAAVSYIMYALIICYHNKKVYQVLLYTSFFSIVVAGHFGAGLTHGMNFLVEPVLKANKPEIDENTPVFTAFIQPILENKCQSCHNADKHKGELDMSTLEKLHAGGENGPVWVAGDTEGSEIVRRSLLPMENEEHMPPEGKPQLTDLEFELIRKWIEQGADEAVTLAQLSKSDTLYVIANRTIEKDNIKEKPQYEFDFADQEVVAALNSPFRSVVQKSPKSPAIDVSVFGRQTFQLEFLTELKQIKDQVVSLNLAYLPINDEAIGFIGQLTNLEQLNLNFTDITGNTLMSLAACTNLTSLSLSGTQVGANILPVISALPALREVFLWNTELKEKEIKELQKKIPNVNVVEGYQLGSEGPLRLNPPDLLNEKEVIAKGEKIELIHRLKNVDIRYTTDGSEPDSLSSSTYTGPLQFDSFGTLKVKSYKEGWLSSEPRSYTFFIKGLEAENVELLIPPNKKYKGKGAITLTDLKKGKATNISAPTWVGYKDNPFTALVDFGEQPPSVNEVVLSYALNMDQYIMAPTSVEVWGGNEKESLTMIKKATPPQAEKMGSNAVEAEKISLGGSGFRYYKVVARPIRKLPNWHRGQGDRGWVFVDELFFY